MGETLLTKLDVDVLVHVAVSGPKEAVDWMPLVKDADELGRRIWTLSYRTFWDGYTAEDAADLDETLEAPAYVFEPLPIRVTAAEGVKQIHYFRYQVSGVEDPFDVDSTLDGLLERLESALSSFGGDPSTAPWGWDQGEVAIRRVLATED